MKLLRKLVKDNLTDYDGETYDTGRCLAWTAFLALTLFQAINYRAFDAMSYAGGVATIVACLGVAIFGDNAKRP